MSEPTILVVQPSKGGWQCVETLGVEEFWADGGSKELAVAYAKSRAQKGFGEILVFDTARDLEDTIPFGAASWRFRRQPRNGHHTQKVLDEVDE